ncbi:MAG: sodium-dependent transporter [Nitrospinaceae bacterium]|nr:sodium-dependent transporter [Nitrospina sp.]MBT5375387.1 sodium-dependent transporter [Nitrospinaceae bacterium]
MKTENNNQRGFWGSRLGFILAASGSAVGLGNIWKFPYIVGQNGGGAFVLIYLACILVIGTPIMLAEFTLGRKTQLNPVGAFDQIRPKSAWVGIGYMGVLAGFFILSFYGVVGGWTFAYVVKALTGAVLAFPSPKEAGAFFEIFIGNTGEVIFYHALFMGTCIAIVLRGVHGGIEKACNVLMPTLVIILFLLMFRSLTLDGAMQGVAFYLTPDFSKISANVVLIALGQAFFSLSLGMGCMITYGSYLSQKENLTSSTIYVVMFDTLIALLVGMVIFPAVFAMGLEPTEGPGLVFSVLPTVFAGMPLGQGVAVIFFILLAIAAITSGISLLEVVVAYFIDQLGWERKRAVLIVGGAIFAFGVPSGLSFGILADVKLLGMNFFEHVDNLASNYFLPLGGMFTAIFVGWVWGTQNAHQEIEKHENKFGFPWAQCWEFLIRYVTPVAVGIVFVAKILP